MIGVILLYAGAYSISSGFPRGSRLAWLEMDTRTCIGNESRLIDCPSTRNPPGVTKSSSYYGSVCSSTTYQLELGVRCGESI